MCRSCYNDEIKCGLKEFTGVGIQHLGVLCELFFFEHFDFVYLEQYLSIHFSNISDVCT